MEIPLVGVKFYEPHKCWVDVIDAISNVKHLIHITRWSVLMLVWNDRTSIGVLKKDWHDSTRRIMSFVGGIGHCDGRYDALFHSSLRTLDIVQLTN
ncbi:hypothetical protein MLD38_031116 [Melastoma candidum]|uniref:Uncharacterized protein n=1 Tax=Melastoma candidum TaxID=119954 RepID=A0ACB9MPW6_9MYRT|nr:hypothetical protein MLD38_031116 [Melastoma candidum]